MAVRRNPKCLWLLTALAFGLACAAYGAERARSSHSEKSAGSPAQPAVPSMPLPDGVQLVGTDTNPIVRIPVGHYFLGGHGRLGGSHGWLDISRAEVRYTMVYPDSAMKSPDSAFQFSPGEITGLKFISTGAIEFRTPKIRHFVDYLSPSLWENLHSTDQGVKSAIQADNARTPVIVRAIQNFDGVVADLKLKQQAAAQLPPIMPKRAATPEVKPTPAEVKPTPPPAPPAVVLVVPAGASENGTVEVSDPTLSIRGMAMDASGLPNITINGATAALRPKSSQATEFWSDPITLQPGDNPVEIVAVNAAQAKASFKFVARYTPRATPANPRALGKPEILSLLQGGVASARIVEIVNERGIKFAPAADDLTQIRSAGGDEDLVQAIERAAEPPR